MQSGDLPLQTNSTLFFSKNIASSVKFFYVSRKFQENLQCPYSKFQRHKLNYLIRINKENILKSLCGLLCTERLATSLECITLINFWKSEGLYYKFTVLNTLGAGKWRAAGHENQVSLTAIARQFYFHWTEWWGWVLHRIHTRHNHIQPAADTVSYKIPLVNKLPCRKLDIY